MSITYDIGKSIFKFAYIYCSDNDLKCDLLLHICTFKIPFLQEVFFYKKRRISYSIKWVVAVILFVAHACHCPSFIIVPKFSASKASKLNKMFLAIITHPSSRRIPVLMEIYGKDIQFMGVDLVVFGQSNPSNEYNYILESDLPTLDAKWTAQGDRASQILNMMKITQASLDYFLSHPQYN